MQVNHHFQQRGGFQPLDYSDTFDAWTFPYEDKQQLRAELEEHRQAFLAAGGIEQKIPLGVSAIKDRPPPKEQKCKLLLPFFEPEATYACDAYQPNLVK